MKQKLLITFMLLLSGFYSFGQTENFESTAVNTIPTGWNRFQSTTHSQPWRVTNAPAANICQGLNAAFINRVQLSSSANPATPSNPITAEDYLVTKPVTIPANGQLKFVSRQGQLGDQSNGSKIFQIKISINADPSNLSAYTLVEEFTEDQMNPTANVCLDKVVDLLAFSGQTVYLAFVKKVTQTSNVIVGDSWFIDDIRFVSKCIAPTLGTATNIAATSATLNCVSSGTGFIIQYNSTSNPSNVITFIPSSITKTGNNVSIPLTGLTPNTNYDFCVRNVCDTATGNISDCAGPFNFTTLGLGVVCSDPIKVVTPLPYLTTDNTANYKDLYDTIQTAPSCGATPATTNYFAGNDVFYSYTATETGDISIKLTPTAPNTSLFVYPSCPTTTTGTPCLAGVANATNTVRVINPFPVVAGNTYIIAISSSAATQTFSYTLVIQNEKCLSLAPVNVNVTSVSTSTATVTWGNPNGATEWDIVVQPVGGQIPNETTPTGTTVVSTTTIPTTISGLDAATSYQIWVRSKCTGPGYSSWVGPIIFNTDFCDASKKCNYKFTLTSTTSGWGGAIMDIKQNGILVRSLVGSIDFTSGTSKVINVPLCDNVNFDLTWRTAGTIPNNIGITVTNSFGQVLFTKTPSVSTPSTTPIFATVPDCDTAVCTIAPTALAVTNVTTNTAQISWTAVSNISFDVYVVQFGNPAPTNASSASFTLSFATPPNTVTLTGLLPDTKYTFYVRVTGSQCPFGPSPWSTGRDFTTIPTCYKPTNVNLSNQTDTSAQISWTNGSPTDTKWEIYLVEMPLPTPTVPDPQPPKVLPSATPPTGVTTVGVIKIVTTQSPYTLTGLDPAKSYYFYIRTVCSTTDSSNWTSPTLFNTTVCTSTGKCNYKFVMTDTGANGWGTTKIRIRQNGITVATLGTQLTGAGPLTVNVSLCPSLPFDVYWSELGANPNEVGLSIQNPFTDVIYNKPPGVDTALKILYQSTLDYNVTTNCTPPTCPKPTNLTVVSTTSTSATLGWTEVGSATEWEIYVVPTAGAIPPVNGAPLGLSSSYFLVNSNPAVVSPLLPSTDYTFWVRAKCSATDISTWTILNPVNFTTKAINDECATAINITPSASSICTSTVSSTTKGGTQSLPTITGTNCTGTNDVWLKFVATSSIHSINLSNIAGGALSHSVFKGTCGNLTLLYCSNQNLSIATGLTPNETYYIKVYSSGTATNTNFNICIKTFPPIVNDDCFTATPALVNSGLICNLLNPGTLTGAVASTSTSSLTNCTGSATDDVWYKFTATTTTYNITLQDIVGSTTNLNFGVYEGNCNSLALKLCSTANSLTNFNTTYTIGQTYFVRVWSNSAFQQEVNFKLCIGSVLPPIKVFDDLTNQQLIEDVFLGTTCASVSNISTKGASNFGLISTTDGLPMKSIGWFDGLGTDFPFKKGIVLTTGDLKRVPGPNTNTLSNGSNAWTGDADLEAILPMTSLNATVLEFDFVPIANKMKLNYLFASEEYGTFQCAFSDAFAFILTHVPTGTKSNVAIVPGTLATPVSVVNVRNNLFNAGCASVNPDKFGNFYGNVVGGLNPLGAPIDFNGLTIPMQAIADVIPGDLFHIKMVIADRQDTLFDSSIYLQENSFDIGNINFGADLLASTGNALCKGDCLTLNANIDPTKFNIKWFKDNVLIAGANSSTLTVCDAGVYKIEVTLLTLSSCIITDSIIIEYFSEPTAATPTSLFVCSSSNVGNFDLTVNTPIITSPFTIPHTVKYFLTEADAKNNVNEIINPSAVTNTTNPQTIYVRVENQTTFCKQYSSFTLNVTDTPKYTLSGNYEVCENNSTTISVSPTGSSFNLTDPNITYRWFYNNNLLVNQTGSSLNISGVNPGNYSVEVSSSVGCVNKTNFVINATKLPNPSFSYPSPVYCSNALPAVPIVVSSSGQFTVIPATGLTVDSVTGIITFNNTPPGIYTITNTVSGTGSCPSVSASTTVQVTPAISVNFNYGGLPICTSSGIISPTYNVIPGPPTSVTPIGTFTISPSGPTIDSVTGAIDVTGATVGVYTITNTVPPSGGCSTVSATTQITLVSPVTAGFSYAQPAYCSNALPVTPILTGVAGTFSANPAGLAIDTTTGSITFTNSQPGVYVISNTVTNSTCPVVVATTTVQVTQAISVNFNYGGLPICTSSGIISPTYNVIPGPPISVTPIGAFTISPSGPTIDSITGAIDVTGATAGVYTITNTILPFGGCSAVSATTQITLVSPVTAGFNYAQPAYCSNALPATPILTGVAGTFSTNPAGLAIDTATGLITFTNSQPGVYVISNTVTNSTCPVVVATTTVQVTPAISVNFNYGATSFCIGSGQIQPNYFVVPGPPSGVTPLGNFTSNPALPINPTTGAIDLATATAGVYTITNTIPAFGGCGVVTATTQITLSTKAVASFSYSNSPYCITSSPANPVLTGTAGTFTVNPTTGLNVNPTTGQITFAGATAGTYTITNSIAANGGCTAVSASTTVVVNKPVKADFSYPSASYCKATGTANPTFGTDAVAGSFTATPAGLSINPATGAINIGLSAIGNYTITNTISATGGCAGDNKTFTLSIVAPASGTISYSTPMCKSSSNTQPVTISAPTGGTYTSSPAGLSMNPTTGLINPSLSLKGDYVITYTVASTNACPIYVTTTSVQIIEVPEFTLTGICQGNLFKISTDVTAQNYSWNGPSGLIPNGTDPKSIVATTAGTYNLTITTSNGCTSKSELIVNSIVCSIQKGISPNGDGKNDTFDLTALGVRHLEIFNRYGTLVYEMDNYTNQWGGNSSAGLELPTGTYFYVIEKKDNSDNITGWIYINR